MQYAATVPNDVTSVTVTATPVNEFARRCRSITGNDNLRGRYKYDKSSRRERRTEHSPSIRSH
ncbi:MAG: hypothetical protein ACLT9J_10670 [Agathobacter rectalis]